MGITKLIYKGRILVFILPVLLPLFIFWIVPLFSAAYMSLTDWDMISPEMNFVGLLNYKELFMSSDFYVALKNTVVFSVGVIIPTIVLGLGVALLCQKNFRGSGFYKFIIFSPWITPMVAVSIVWSWIFDPVSGIANMILNALGQPGLEWLKSSKTAMLSVIIVTVWKGLGWTMIFYIGALEKIPETLYEAAELDGAHYFQRLFKITLPLISPTTLFLVVTNLINCIQVFDQIDVLTQGGPAGSTRTLLYMYYQSAFQNFEVGRASAISIVVLMITVILAIINSYFSKRWVHY